MPFGLTNAPTIFQIYINKALIGLVDVYCVIYLDNIFIYFKDKKKHERHVRAVFKRLKRYKLYAKRSKYIFYIISVEFLNFIISIKGVSIDSSRVDSISTWPMPKSFKDV
jgi:Reverse transcriptase (RNA-dependent DNA polymerase)